MQTRNAAAFQCSAAVRVLQLGSEGPCGEVLCCPLVLGSGPAQLFFLWEACGQVEGLGEGGWFSCRVMKALEVWRL